MRCDEVIPLLSPFHDDELAPDQHRAVEEHIAGCKACMTQLESFQRLSNLVETTLVPDTPAQLVQKVEQSLREKVSLWDRFHFGSQPQTALVALTVVAASVVLAFFTWRFTPHDLHSHAEMNQIFGRFLDTYERDQTAAVEILPAKYEGQIVTEQTASSVLKRPTVARPVVLANHEVTKRYLLKMPCCECIQTAYSCNGKISFVLLEHQKEQLEWFGTRPMVHAQCHGKACCMVQLTDGLVATWPVDGGFVTVVGVSDVNELDKLVDELRPSQL